MKTWIKKNKMDNDKKNIHRSKGESKDGGSPEKIENKESNKKREAFKYSFHSDLLSDNKSCLIQHL